MRWSDCAEVYGYGDMRFVSIIFPETFGSLCFVWVCWVLPPLLFLFIPVAYSRGCFHREQVGHALSVCVCVCVSVCEWMSLLLSTEWELCFIRFVVSFLIFLL